MSHIQDSQNNVYHEMGVSVKNANNPVYIFDESPPSFGVTVFQTFTNGAVSPTKFDVPNIYCNEEGATDHDS